MKSHLMVRSKHQCVTHLVQIWFTRFTWFSEGGGIFKSNKQGGNLYFASHRKTLQLSRVVSITFRFSVTHPQLANFNYRVFTSCFNRPELNRTILQLPATICSLLLSFFAFRTFFGTGSQIYWPAELLSIFTSIALSRDSLQSFTKISLTSFSSRFTIVKLWVLLLQISKLFKFAS